jgi:hypothetical protein
VPNALRRAGGGPALLVAALSVGIWVISPRFSITGPSLIDDWDALVSAPARLHALVHFDYQVQTRFYPTWILWNWVQWRVPGAPGNLLAPNLLGVARLALLVFGMTAFASIIVPRRQHPLERALICTLPALLVVTVPAFGVDLARFGPQEPALVGGMMLGGSLLYLGGRDLAADPVRRPVRAWLLVVVGSFAWCYGVFTKETSVCVFLALPLAIVLLRGAARRARRRQFEVATGLGALALLPALVMLYEVVRIVQRGSLEYGAHIQNGRGSVSVFAHALRVMPHQLMSFTGVVVLATVVVALAVGAVSRPPRPDWLLLTILVVALAALEMSVQTDFYESRYYLPSVALLAVGAARAVGGLPARYMRLLLAGACVLALVSATKAHTQVKRWAKEDQQGDVIVGAVRATTDDGCRLSIAGIDEERSQAIKALVEYGRGHVDCVGAARHVLVGPSATQTPQAACAPSGGRTVGTWPFLGSHEAILVRCGGS